MPIIDRLDEGADAGACLAGVAVTGIMDFLFLECPHEPFGFGIVIGVADPAHAGGDVMHREQGCVIATGILHTPVAMVDQAASCWLTGCNRHGERINGKRRPQVRLQGPPDHLAAIGIKHHCQIGELFGHMDIGDVSDPQLIKPGEDHPARVVGHHPPAMLAVSSDRHKCLHTQAQQIILAHYPQHTLVVRLPALTPQKRSNPPITIAPVVQRQTLDRIAKPGLRAPGR